MSGTRLGRNSGRVWQPIAMFIGDVGVVTTFYGVYIQKRELKYAE